MDPEEELLALSEPEEYTVKQLKSKLSAAGVELPSKEEKKVYYVELVKEWQKKQKAEKNKASRKRKSIIPPIIQASDEDSEEEGKSPKKKSKSTKKEETASPRKRKSVVIEQPKKRVKDEEEEEEEEEVKPSTPIKRRKSIGTPRKNPFQQAREDQEEVLEFVKEKITPSTPKPSKSVKELQSESESDTDQQAAGWIPASKPISPPKEMLNVISSKRKGATDTPTATPTKAKYPVKKETESPLRSVSKVMREIPIPPTLVQQVKGEREFAQETTPIVQQEEVDMKYYFLATFVILLAIICWYTVGNFIFRAPQLICPPGTVPSPDGDVCIEDTRVEHFASQLINDVKDILAEQNGRFLCHEGVIHSTSHLNRLIPNSSQLMNYIKKY